MFGFGKKNNQNDDIKNEDREGEDVKKTGFIDKMKGKAIEKMMEKQMKNLPEEQKAVVLAMVEKNPDFFQNIAQEIQDEVKSGKNQMAASMKVMRKHQAKMQQLMMESAGGDPRMSNRNLH